MRPGGLLALVAVCAAATGCGGGMGGDTIDGIFTEAEWALIETLSPLPEIPPADPTNAVADDAGAAALGQMFYFETSHAGPIVTGDDGENGGLGAAGESGLIACASCHSASSEWLDDDRSNPPAISLGADWIGRNAPPVVNAAYYEWFTWDGAADSMWAQATGTTESVSHNSTRLDVAHMIHETYEAEYEAVFGDIDPRFDPGDPDAADFPPSGKPGDAAYDDMDPADQLIVDTMYANFGKAIAAYERLLISRDAPFDQYVAGDFSAINLSAKRGLQLFIGKAACVECHATPLFSDNEFHNLGVPQEGENVPATDEGRFDAVAKVLASPFNGDGAFSDDTTTGKLDGLEQRDEQRGRFRTKHLRQIAETAPYMHTGQFATLREVVEFYDGGGGDTGFSGTKDSILVPLNLSTQEIDDLVAFLETLTGAPIPAALLEDTSK